MPDGPYATPDEERLLRMLRAAGTPEDAGQNLLARLEALEASVAALQARAEPDEEAASASDDPVDSTP